ncbi:MAG: hypothetical protein KIT31_16410 [Deltaproteobacteria bacterium]|nr:hypothetical protein [Deltaproteobacteria bacterium]
MSLKDIFKQVENALAFVQRVRRKRSTPEDAAMLLAGGVATLALFRCLPLYEFAIVGPMLIGGIKLTASLTTVAVGKRLAAARKEPKLTDGDLPKS